MDAPPPLTAGPPAVEPVAPPPVAVAQEPPSAPPPGGVGGGVEGSLFEAEAASCTHRAAVPLAVCLSGLSVVRDCCTPILSLRRRDARAYWPSLAASCFPLAPARTAKPTARPLLRWSRRVRPKVHAHHIREAALSRRRAHDAPQRWCGDCRPRRGARCVAVGERGGAVCGRTCSYAADGTAVGGAPAAAAAAVGRHAAASASYGLPWMHGAERAELRSICDAERRQLPVPTTAAAASTCPCRTTATPSTVRRRRQLWGPHLHARLHPRPPRLKSGDSNRSGAESNPSRAPLRSFCPFQMRRRRWGGA
jgi:hypothetical protein